MSVGRLTCLFVLAITSCSEGTVTPDKGTPPPADGPAVEALPPTESGIDRPRLEAGTGKVDGRKIDGAQPGACGAITTFEAGKSPQKEIHVSKSGNDSTGDGSAGKPLATLAAAVKKATAGTAVRIHAGTYAGGNTWVENVAGTATAPVWIGGAPGEARPIIQGGGEAMHLIKVRYVIVHDLEVSGTTSNGINCDDGSDYSNPDASRYVVFRNLSIHDVGSGGNQDCLKLSGLNDYFILDSTFSKCGGGGSGSAIDHVGCHHGLIARNTFQNLQGNGVQCKGGSEDIEVRANTFIEAGERAVNMGGSTGFEFFRPPLSTSQPNAEARNIRVIANLIRGGTSSLAFVGCVDCLAANNTIVNPHNWILRILQETVSGGGYTFLPASKSRFINNLVYFDRSDLSVHVNIGPDTQPSSFTFENNLWFAHDNPSAGSQPNLPVSETGGLFGQNPALVNPGAGDFHIPASSPAATKGKPLVEVKSDFSGACYASPPSIGAYQAK